MKILAAIIVLIIAFPAEARDQNQVWKFRKANPCPSTGKVKGACPGWNVDHVKALRCGGIDRPSNMQWLTIPAHKIKTRHEARTCRAARNR